MITLSAIGALGRDCSVKQLDKGSVINFSIGVSVGYGEHKSTTWLECSKFGESTAVAQYLLKGTKVYVQGEPSLRTFDKKDGTKGTSLTLRVDKVELLGSKQENVASTGNSTTERLQPSPILPDQEPIDDLPF